MIFLFEKICVVCNKKYFSIKNNQKKCSKLCVDEFRRIKNRKLYVKIHIEKECFICKNKFFVKLKNQYLCSKKCQIQYREIYRLNHLERLKQIHKIYMSNPINKQHFIEYSKKWNLKNKDKVLRSNFIRNKNRFKNDINYRILIQIRNRIRQAFRVNRNYKKQNKTINLLGCTILQLKQYLEKQFKEGMSWENHSIFGWHIDHIIPCSSFDLSKKEEQEKCFHYSNLQPLWAYENWSKNKKIQEKLIEV